MESSVCSTYRAFDKNLISNAGYLRDKVLDKKIGTKKKKETKLKSAVNSSELKPWIFVCCHGESEKVNFSRISSGKSLKFFSRSLRRFSPSTFQNTWGTRFLTPRHEMLSCPINWNIKEIYGSFLILFRMINLRHFLFFFRWMCLWTGWAILAGVEKGCLQIIIFAFPFETRQYQNFSSTIFMAPQQ